MPNGETPEDARPGDYWLVTNDEGELLQVNSPGNLTKLRMNFIPPQDEPGSGYATLGKHTIRVEADGTCSVRPNDGSSNSIACTTQFGYWHGYLYHGYWTPV